MAECQMKRAHAGKRVMKEALAKIVIDEHHVQSIAGVTLTCPGTMGSFSCAGWVLSCPGPRHDDRCVYGSRAR